MNILLVRLRLIGDVVFTTPMLPALKRRFPPWKGDAERHQQHQEDKYGRSRSAARGSHESRSPGAGGIPAMEILGQRAEPDIDRESHSALARSHWIRFRHSRAGGNPGN